MFFGCVYVHATVISAGVPKAYDYTNTLLILVCIVAKLGMGMGLGMSLRVHVLDLCLLCVERLAASELATEIYHVTKGTS